MTRSIIISSKPIGYFLIALLLVLDFRAEARKKPVAKAPKFSTDWNNPDSLRYHFKLQNEIGNLNLTLQLSDSLMKHTSGEELNALFLAQTDLLLQAGRNSEAVAKVDQWLEELKSGRKISVNYPLTKQLADLYSRAGNFQKAYALILEHQSLEELIQEERIQKLAQETETLKSGQMRMESDLKSAGDQARTYSLLFWTVLGLSLVIKVILAFILVRQKRLRKEKSTLEQQMSHTLHQMEKAQDSSDKQSSEIKKMKEQLARVEAEKAQLQSQIQLTTSELLPTLRSQLESISKETLGQIPVDKYMQLQNTITRLNKQFKDI